ncbi:MAG: DNA polymerase III subunit delta' [Rikenellaceae bacterium]
MLFKDIIGQDKIKKQLIENVKNGRIPHAQLFSGLTGYGSLAMAMAYAQYVNCENRGEEDSCGKCGNCYKYNNLQHPDLHFIFPINKSPHAVGSTDSGDIVSDNLIDKWREIFNNSKPKGYFSLSSWYDVLELSKNSQGTISRAEANDLIEKLSFKSFEGGYTVVIIWLAEQMNESAANALLKLFEEPADKTLFLFISHNSEKILKTIISRTQLVYIKPVDNNSVKEYVLSKGLNNYDSENIAHLSQGDICEAELLLEHLNSGELNENFNYFVSLMRLCFSVNYLALLPWAESMAALGKEEQKEFLTYSIKLLRDSYSLTIGLSELTFTYNYETQFLQKFHPYVHHQNIEKLIEEFEKCSYHLSQNVNSKTVFTYFTLAVSKLIKLPDGK